MPTLTEELSNRALNSLSLILDRESPARIDWMGLADRLDFSTGMVLALKNNCSRERSPTIAVLEEWERIAGSDANMGNLMSLLDSIGCGEGVDILREELARKFRRMDNEGSVSPQPSQGSISSSESVDHIPLASMEAGNSANVNDPTVRYDVFLSYADEDSEFAKEMMKRLREAHLRVFIPSDVMPGKVLHREIANMIRKECRKTVIILSPDYVNSEWCSYEADLAMVDSPDARKHKLIPVLYRPCEVPSFLVHLYYSDYPRHKNDRTNCENFFWKTLYKSLKHIA